MSRPEEVEEGDDEEAEEMFSDPNLVDNEDEYDDDDDGRHYHEEEDQEDDGEGSYVDVDDDEEEKDGEDYGDYYQDDGEGEGEEYYEGSQSFSHSHSHSRSYSHSQNNTSSRYEGEGEGEGEDEDEDENGHDSGSYSQYDDDGDDGEEGERGEEENSDDSQEYDDDDDDSRLQGDDDDIPHNETDDTDDFEDSKEYFDDQQNDDEDGDDDGDGSYYDDEDQDHYHDENGSRAEEEGSYEDDDYDDDGNYVGDGGDESRSRSRRYEEEDDEDEGNSPSRSSYNNSPSRSSDRWSDGSDGRSPTSPRSPIENSPNFQPPVHNDDDHQSPEDMKREVQEILKAANERLSSPQKQKGGGGRSSSVNNQEEGQETTAEPSSSNKAKPNGGSISDATTTNGTNGSRSAANQNQRNNRPNHDNGGRRSAESSVGETSLDNTGHMEALKEDRTNQARETVTSSEKPALASATKKDEGLPKGSTSSRSRRNGRMGGSSSHHRRRQQQQGQGGFGGARISWKSDPEATFSDWTVRVYHDEGGGGMDKYFIHRNICGFGIRKSEYLLRAFQGQENEMTRPGIKSDMQNRTTLLDLPSSQARVFPMVLDFIYYTKEAKSTLTASRACDVFLLAGILEIPTLQKAISDFYLKNLNLKNMGEFLNAANQSKAEPLLVVCKSKIGKMITEKPTLAGLVPPKYLADILLISRQQLDNARAQDPERYPEQLVVSQSRYWSKAACICAVQNENILTKNLFELLTGEDALPYIDASVAQKLLALDKKFNGVEPDGYTSLQLRCIAGIADDFGSFQKGFQSEEAAVESLKEWPSHVLADILVKTMNKK